jgi:hypothetical protein
MVLEVGLVGFHIVIKTPQRENWIWSTFEHVDNTESSPDGIRPPSFSSEPEGIPWNEHELERPKDWQTIKPGNPPITDPVEVSRRLDEAESWDADLIVLVSHGYKGWQRFLLGSVSHAIATHAHCSVKIVRQKPVTKK